MRGRGRCGERMRRPSGVGSESSEAEEATRQGKAAAGRRGRAGSLTGGDGGGERGAEAPGEGDGGGVVGGGGRSGLGWGGGLGLVLVCGVGLSLEVTWSYLEYWSGSRPGHSSKSWCHSGPGSGP